MNQPNEDRATEARINSMIFDDYKEFEYRISMLKLSWQITAQDMEELKYVLTSLIPDGKKESLTTALELFRYLEQILFVGPDNLSKLIEILRQMDKPNLYEVILTKTERTKELNS